MPQIPRQIAPTAVPMPEVSPQVAGSGYQELARAGQRFESLGEYGMHVAGMIQKAQDHVALLKAENLIESDIDAAAESFAMRTDYEAFEGDTQKIGEDLKKKYGELYANNPRVWQAVEPYLDRNLEHFRHAIAAKGVKLLTDEGQYELEVSEQSAAEKWAHATTPEEKAMVENDYSLKLTDAAASHIISKKEAGRRETRFVEKREETEAILLAKSQNPADVELGIKRLSEGYYKHIDPAKSANLQAAAETHLVRLNEHLDKTTREGAVNNAIGALKAEWGTEYPRIFSDLANTQVWEKYGLDSKGVEQLRTFFNGERAEFEAAKRDASEKEYLKGVRLLDQGKFSQVHAMVRNPNTPLSAEHAHTLSSAATVREKRDDADISNTDDAKAYWKIKTMMDAGEEPDKVAQEIITSPNLKRATRERLLDRVDMIEDKTIHAGLTSADKYFNSQIAPSSTKTGLPIPEDQAFAQKAHQDLVEWVKGEKKLAAEGKRKSVTEREIFDRAVEMTPSYQIPITEKINIIRQQAEEMRRGRKGQKPTTTGPPAVGTVDAGYRFLGGDPSKPENWKKVE
jgi:hypothetical protein